MQRGSSRRSSTCRCQSRRGSTTTATCAASPTRPWTSPTRSWRCTPAARPDTAAGTRIPSPAMSAPDLDAAASAVETARGVVHGALAHLATTGSVDADQVVAYDLAHAAAAVETARTLLDYGARGDEEAAITCAFAADAVADVAARLYGREAAWGVEASALDAARRFVAAYRDPAFLASVEGPGPRHLDDDFELVQDTSRRFAEDKIRPVAEHVHRDNADIPEDVISGLAELGAFGLSVPEEYGGFAAGGESDYMGMVVATEELSRASLGVGGSLITRPE